MHILLGALVSSIHVLIKLFAKRNYTLNETQGGILWTIINHTENIWEDTFN